MSNAADYLTDLFGSKPDAPSPEPAAADLVAPDNPATPADRTADALEPIDVPDHAAQPDALDFGPDGWPAGSIDPEPCPTCPRLRTWQDVGGRWRCERCDGEQLGRSTRWADAAARARQQQPARHTATHTRPPTPPYT